MRARGAYYDGMATDVDLVRRRFTVDEYQQMAEAGILNRGDRVELIRGEIRKCNTGLPPASRIRRFLLLNKQLDADDNEVTRTRKIRRRFIADKYAAVIVALYAGQSDVELVADITFEDGRKSTIRSNVRIDDAEDMPQAMLEPAHA